MSVSFDLSGRVALVTGGSRGIGEAMAKGFAQYGARVIVSSRKQEACDEVAAEINAAGGRATAIACHIGDMDALHALFARVQAEFGRLDVLVNNAAANPYYGHVLDTDLGAFQKTVDVNVRGYFFASVHAGRMMRAQGKGSIINVASVNAVRPGPKQGIYSITKGAVLSMTKTFAKECGPHGIRCNAILPGFMDTPMAVEGGARGSGRPVETVRAERNARVPLRGRMGTGWDTAYAALFLCCDESAFITGALLPVDGGMGTRIG